MTKSKIPQPLSGKKFPDILYEPLPRVPREAIQALAFSNSDEVKATAKRLASNIRDLERFERLRVILTHYGIDIADPACLMKLLDCLLRDFVVAFSTEREIGNLKKGRKKGKHTLNRVKLYFAVTELQKKSKGLSVQKACKKLMSQERDEWGHFTLDALAKQFQRFKTELARYENGVGQDPARHDIDELVAKFTSTKK